MKVRSLYPLTAALGAWAACPLAAAEPAPLPAVATTADQMVADRVAERLTSMGLAQFADVSIEVKDGTLTLTGTAKDAGAKQLVVFEARQVAGVALVRDGLSVLGDKPAAPAVLASVVQAQAASQPVPVEPSLVSHGHGPFVEPAPVGPPGMSAPDTQAPPLPPYAWPTYAPYNNVSRVAYPQAYPYNAFPFIGPYYPFPKVPLGWRKVTLEWEDGHWYLGRAAAPHDYWRVKFW